MPCERGETKLTISSCDKAVARCSMVVVGQSGPRSMSRMNVGERETHTGGPLDGEQAVK